ncbi:hypothetical protein LINGRAHAP2_LOCUS13149 [Linum grandiflorum]
MGSKQIQPMRKLGKDHPCYRDFKFQIDDGQCEGQDRDLVRKCLELKARETPQTDADTIAEDIIATDKGSVSAVAAGTPSTHDFNSQYMDELHVDVVANTHDVHDGNQSNDSTMGHRVNLKSSKLPIRRGK